jgi:hypothetical protein
MKRCCVFSILFGGFILAAVNVLFNPLNYIYGDDAVDAQSESKIDLQAELEKGLKFLALSSLKLYQLLAITSTIIKGVDDIVFVYS